MLFFRVYFWYLMSLWFESLNMAKSISSMLGREKLLGYMWWRWQRQRSQVYNKWVNKKVRLLKDFLHSNVSSSIHWNINKSSKFVPFPGTLLIFQGLLKWCWSQIYLLRATTLSRKLLFFILTLSMQKSLFISNVTTNIVLPLEIFW